jgi:hypothetical protein
MADERRLDATGDRRQRPEMENIRCPFDRAVAVIGIGECPADNIDPLVVSEIFDHPGAEIIEDANAIPLTNEFVREVRSDEAGPAGDHAEFGHIFPMTTYDYFFFGQ